MIIELDKIKIATSTKLIKRFDENLFTPVYKVKKLIGYKYKQTKPSELLILINYEKDEAVIEFTSKICEYSFYNLINEDTISECLYSIAPLVEFEGYVEDILDEFEVLKCDVTKDVTHSDVKKLERYVKTNLANYDKWKCEKYPTGFVLKNVVSTPRYKKRIVIYDKQNDKAQNIHFHQEHNHSQNQPSVLENVGVALGGLFDIQPSGTDYDPDEVEFQRQHKSKKKKKERRPHL